MSPTEIQPGVSVIHPGEDGAASLKPATSTPQSVEECSEVRRDRAGGHGLSGSESSSANESAFSPPASRSETSRRVLPGRGRATALAQILPALLFALASSIRWDQGLDSDGCGQSVGVEP